MFEIRAKYIIKKNNINFIYWVVRKVHADFEGKLKRRRLNF